MHSHLFQGRDFNEEKNILCGRAPAMLSALAFEILPIVLLLCSCTRPPYLPNHKLTPGAVVNLPVETICAPGYSRQAREVSRATKLRVCALYRVPSEKCNGQNYELDHLIALEIGGSNDITNLWPEPHQGENGAETKDRFENYLHRQVCSGKMPISKAQKMIRSNWYKNYKQASRP
jgi:hypothetical protein